jgi:N-acetylmuramoyl-L-alanine amidase CwlA
MSIAIKQSFITGGKLGSGTDITEMNGVTIHDTGNPKEGADAEWHARYLKSDYAASREASWHFAVDEKGAIQSIPTNKTSWHCGKRAGNTTTVSIEICVNADGDIMAATRNAAELAATILRGAGLPVDGHLFQHHDWSGKNCPAQLRAGNPCTWDEFKNIVKNYYGA